MYEIEIKFVGIKPLAIVRRLNRLGATDLGDDRIERVTYFTPNTSRKDDRWRLRDHSKKGVQLTYKIKHSHPDVKLAEEFDFGYKGTYDQLENLVRNTWRCTRRHRSLALDKTRRSYLLAIPVSYGGERHLHEVCVEIDKLDEPDGMPQIVELERTFSVDPALFDEEIARSVLALKEAARMLDLPWELRSRRSTAKEQEIYRAAHRRA